jgi:hypothetical protein
MFVKKLEQLGIIEPEATPKPTMQELEEWDRDGGCFTPCGCWVEPDGTCEHGQESWLLKLGWI